MKALSIKQPWAELILQGRKKIELRKWNTQFRGEFLIHSSKTEDKDSMKKFGFKELPTGFILGKVDLVNVKKYNNNKEFSKDKNLHLAGREWGDHGFILKNPKRIKKIKHKGNLGFWNFNRELAIPNLIKSAYSSKEILEIYQYIKPLNLGYPDYKKWIEKCKRELEFGYKKAFYYKENSKIIGVIIFQPHKKEKDILEIKNFRVSPINQKKGIGSLLYNSLEQYAKKQKFKIVQIETHNDKMLDFLLKKGFKIIKKEALYSSKQLEIILQKKLWL